VTPSPSPTAPVTETTITLQQGNNGYMGCEDTHIDQSAPNTNYCWLNAFKVGDKQQYAALLRFELPPIPTNAIVTHASLQLYAPGWGGSDMTVDAYRILRTVNLCQATWNQAQQGNDWGTPGCNDTFTDRGAAPESSVPMALSFPWCILDLTGLVQDWANGSLANNGLLLRAASLMSTSMFRFASVQNETVYLRPKLVITYRVGDNPHATPTATRTPTNSPVVTPTSAHTPTPTRMVSPTPDGYRLYLPTVKRSSRVRAWSRRIRWAQGHIEGG
jgi:hypothetical protein